VKVKSRKNSWGGLLASSGGLLFWIAEFAWLVSIHQHLGIG